MYQVRSSLVAAFAIALMSPAVAFAQGQPGLPPVPVSEEPFQFPFVNDTCGFEVLISLSGKGGTIQLPGDRLVLNSPGLTGTLTNLSSDPPKTISLIASGAFHVTSDAAGNQVFVITGRNVVWDPLAGFVLTIGVFSYAFDARGNLIQPLSGIGRKIDLCALLR